MTKQLNLLEGSLERTLDSPDSNIEKETKRIVEALLFSTNEPLSLQKIKEIVETAYTIKPADLKRLIAQLGDEYKERGHAFRIEEIGDGYLLRTVEEMRPFIQLAHQDKRGEKLTRAATEVLAIIAYRGPVTKREIENLRGVDTTGPLASLLERGLIEATLRKEAPGKPLQYQITKKFLQHFGLKDLNALPNL